MENRLEVGVDIENIDRFTKLVADNDRNFFDKIYTREELDYCFSKKFPAQHLAARFSAKEAVVKALTGFGAYDGQNADLKSIEVSHDHNNAPVIKLDHSKLKNLQDLDIKISLAHCQDKALAFAVVRSLIR